MRLKLGWRMEIRRLLIKLGLVKKPLFTAEDFDEYRKQTMVRRKLMLIGFCIPHRLMKDLINHEPRVDDLMTVLFAVSNYHGDEQYIIYMIHDLQLVKVVASPRPLHALFNDDLTLLPEALRDEIKRCDDAIETGIGEDVTLSPTAVLFKLHAK